jgi:hypothetical protein
VTKISKLGILKQFIYFGRSFGTKNNEFEIKEDNIEHMTWKDPGSLVFGLVSICLIKKKIKSTDVLSRYTSCNSNDSNLRLLREKGFLLRYFCMFAKIQ